MKAKRVILNSLIFSSTLITGYIIGASVERSKKANVGVLRIDKSEENSPEKIFLELNTDIETLKKCRSVELKVVNKNYVTRK